jgi:hypothetical protein
MKTVLIIGIRRATFSISYIGPFLLKTIAIMLKKILIALVIVLVLIQFFRPERNLSDDRTNDISKKYVVPEHVSRLLAGGCNDCHSNKTTYPWYTNIQPIGWWMAGHVNEGKGHLNFSSFTHRNLAYQNHKFEEIIEMVKEKEMPLPSYTWLGLHPEANLTDDERNQIVQWASAQMDTLKKNYPADSLVMKRRGAPPTGSQ